MRARLTGDIGALLGRALEADAATADAAVTVGEVHARPWCSATFEGERCRVVLYFAAPPTAWLDALPEAELPMRLHYVADLRICSVAAGGAELEALVLKEA